MTGAPIDRSKWSRRDRIFAVEDESLFTPETVPNLMLTRDELLGALLDECALINHLYSKIPDGGFDYRPAPDQRTTLELLRYLAMCAVAPMHTFIAGDQAAGLAVVRRTESMTAEEFPAMMELQMEELRELFSKMTDEEMAAARAKTITGKEISLPLAIIKMPLAWLTAYRMQLFLYLKAAGARELNTANLWAGIDWKEREKEAESTAAD